MTLKYVHVSWIDVSNTIVDAKCVTACKFETKCATTRLFHETILGYNVQVNDHISCKENLLHLQIEDVRPQTCTVTFSL